MFGGRQRNPVTNNLPETVWTVPCESARQTHAFHQLEYASLRQCAARPQEHPNSGRPRSRNDDAGTGDPAALQIVVSGDDIVEPVGAARADIEDASLNCIEQVRSRSFQLRAMLCVDGPTGQVT